MVIREINQFKLTVGDYTDISVSVPCSVISALTDAEILPDPYFSENLSACLGVCRFGARLRAEFDVDTLTLGMDYSFLRVCGVDAPATVLVNGSPIASLARSDVPYELDVKRSLRAGVNTLEIRFPGRESESFSDISVFAPIELVSYNRCIINEVVVADTHVGGSVRLDISVSTVGYAKSLRTVAVLVSPGGSVKYCTVVDGKGWIDIASPNLWRPDGTGNARLYRLTVNLYSEAELIDTREYKIGLRSISYDDASSSISLSGAAFYPTVLTHGMGDCIKPRATDDRARLMLTRAKEAGINMIFLCGRDSYPGECFLSVCDELGIALAVELIQHGCLGSPIEQGIARRQLDASLRRFVNHPSVIAIVGGDDVEYTVGVMRKILPNAVYMKDFDTCTQVAPSLMTYYTAARYLSSSDMNVYSKALMNRPRAGWDILLSAICTSYRMPSSFAEWCYLSGVISGELAADTLRKKRRTVEGIGAVCGALGEPMPMISPSLLDYSTRAKAMYYYLRRASRSVDTYAVANEGLITFHTTNMQSKIYKARLNYAITDNRGVDVVRDSVDISVDPCGTYEAYKYDASEVIRGHEREYVVTYSVSDGPEVHSSGSCMLVPMRDFILLDPGIRAEISGASSEYTVTLTASAYVRAVEIYFEGDDDVILENNYFDMTGSVPVRVKLVTRRPTALETLRREMRVRSMYDVGRM